MESIAYIDLTTPPHHEMRFVGHRDQIGPLAHIWAYGYCIDSSDRAAFDNAIAESVLNALDSGADLSGFVRQLNGHFAIIMQFEVERSLICCLDRYGTIPLYYHIAQKKLFISDRAVKVALAAGLKTFNPNAVTEMLRLGYVTGTKTLVDGVEEMPHASIVRFRYATSGWEISTERYWRFSFTNVSARPAASLKQQLVDTLSSVACRYSHAIEVLDGPAAVPLSGGLDSRLIVSMFPHHLAGAISYGHPDCEEVVVASQVAQAANLQHHIIPTHRSEPFVHQLRTGKAVFDIGATARFNCGIGVRIVEQQGLPYRIWLPGHTGDFISGGHINRGTFLVRSETQATQLISDNHSLLPDTLITLLAPDIARSEHWQKTIAEQVCFSSEDPVGSIERWDCEQRQRRMIFTDLRAYERIGRWLLPYWDNDLVDFFCSLPVHLKYHQKLYIDTVIEKFFIDSWAAFSQIPRAEKGNLKAVHLGLKDQIALFHLPRFMIHWIFSRGSAKKSQLKTVPCIPLSRPPNEPDPITVWWFEDSEFRREITADLSSWDGLGGIIDVAALRRLLHMDGIACSFIKYGVPSLLTMLYLQDLLTEGRTSLLSQ